MFFVERVPTSNVLSSQSGSSNQDAGRWGEKTGVGFHGGVQLAGLIVPQIGFPDWVVFRGCYGSVPVDKTPRWVSGFRGGQEALCNTFPAELVFWYR